MLTEVIEILAPKKSGIYVDATFGDGGYSKAILKHEIKQLIAFDRDPSVINQAEKLQEKYTSKFKFINDKFSAIGNYLKANSVDGIVFDIGVSSMQIDQAERGFSYMKSGPLDMRMSNKGLSAKELINSFSKEEISDIIYKLGEEKNAKKIASAIVNHRSQNEIATTKDLKNIIENTVPKKYELDAVKKTFQAIRIYINDELNELKKALTAAKKVLKSNGKLIVVTFHSLEDRIVKDFINENINRSKQNKYKKEENKSYIFDKSKSGLIKVGSVEASENIRARSAKLRYSTKV
jgi:16S rRNA (cytosine1402-N4)-methyltransferase